MSIVTIITTAAPATRTITSQLDIKLFQPMGCFGGSSSGRSGSGGSKDDVEEDKKRKEANKRIEKQIQKDKQIYRATHRLLLLGAGESGMYILPIYYFITI